jgi:hypothetical protein
MDRDLLGILPFSFTNDLYIVQCGITYLQFYSLLCIQVQLYEDFAKSRAKQGLDDVVTTLGGEEDTKKHSPSIGHVFQVKYSSMDTVICFI